MKAEHQSTSKQEIRACAQHKESQKLLPCLGYLQKHVVILCSFKYGMQFTFVP